MFDYEGAKQAGFTDEQIEQYLKENNEGFDITNAKKAGFTEDQIAEHLSSRKSPTRSQDIRNFAQKTGDFIKDITIGGTIEFGKLIGGGAGAGVGAYKYGSDAQYQQSVDALYQRRNQAQQEGNTALVAQIDSLLNEQAQENVDQANKDIEGYDKTLSDTIKSGARATLENVALLSGAKALSARLSASSNSVLRSLGNTPKFLQGASNIATIFRNFFTPFGA